MARVRWQAGVVLDPELDPFDLTPAPVRQVGVPVELDEDTLFPRLAELLLAEQELDHEGVRCPIKPRSDTSCNACPIAGRYGELCKVGREQESVLTRLAVSHLGE